MLKVLSFSIVIILLPTLIFAQSQSQYFDVPGFGISVTIDSSVLNSWEIGAPEKVVFDAAATSPNAIVTKLDTTYPVNDSSMFTLISNPAPLGIWAAQWQQKLDMEEGVDGGIVELSKDNGLTWVNVIGDTSIENFYGYDTTNVDTLFNGEMGFTGSDSTWRNIWVCVYTPLQFQGVQLRFRFVSDSMDTQQEGWMMDNFGIDETIAHTIAKVPSEESLQIMPNPTSDILHIEKGLIENYELIEGVEFINSEGVVVQQYFRMPEDGILDISHHPNGTYLLKVKVSGKIEVYKVLLSHE